VRVHDFTASLPAWRGWSAEEEICQVLDLPDDPARLFEDAFTSQNRNKIRKAEKLGLQVRRSDARPDLERYAELYAESAARWQLETPLPRAFFVALAAAPGVDVWLAERAGECVAALLNFRCGGQIMNWGNVSRRDAWGASPNNLLHWRALESACRDRSGPRLYNFGGSTGLPGVETFKTAFGARVARSLRRERLAPWAAWLQRRRRAAAAGE
jgi:lipid II:glycine glycyltransferase (peptidoglycan interpeptide bridge formation enzyme)